MTTINKHSSNTIPPASFSHAQSYGSSYGSGYGQPSSSSNDAAAAAAAAKAAKAKKSHHIHMMNLAHGWVMGVAFAILFPVGAMLMHLLGGRTRHVAWIHGIWQLFSLALGIAGAGLGGWLVANEGGSVSLLLCPDLL